jgi:hypothetical protein
MRDDAAKLVPEGDCYFCFEEFFLLLCGRHTLQAYQNSLNLSRSAT